MRIAVILASLLAGITALSLLNPVNGFARDAGLISMIACIGVYLGWTMPLGDD
jgi:hypothetical protein